MQSLVPVVYMFFGVSIFIAGFVAGRDHTKEPKKSEGSFFIPLPTVSKAEDAPKQPDKEEEDNRNKFFK